MDDPPRMAFQQEDWEMNIEKLKVVLDAHALWLNSDCGEGKRANLHGANLRWADLRWADLRRANLSWADLSGANLHDANLSGADLSGADLSRADLRRTDLSRADLSRANLSGADLHEANLSGANLHDANLHDANLHEADLSGADLRNATGNMREVRSIQCDTWCVAIYAGMMSIGCQTHSIVEWWGFDDMRIDQMDSKALDWWHVWKPVLKSIIEVPGK